MSSHGQGLPAHCRRIAQSAQWQGTILALIMLNALCMGAEAVPAIAELHADLLYQIFVLSQLIFVVEIGIRLLAHAPRPGGFFADGWNRFDFTIVALSLLPATGSFLLAARLLRLLRIVRVFSVSGTLRSSFASAGVWQRLQLALLTGAIAVYVFALAGFHLLAGADPAHWGSLGPALTSVGQLLLPTQALAVMRPALAHSAGLIVYFVLFYLVLAALLLRLSGRPGRPGSGA